MFYLLIYLFIEMIAESLIRTQIQESATLNSPFDYYIRELQLWSDQNDIIWTHKTAKVGFLKKYC